MKAKRKTIESLILFIVIVIDAYLLYYNVDIKNYYKKDAIKSTANYIKTEDNKIYTNEDVLLEEKDKIVYDGLTIDELSDKLNRSLNSTISGKGNLIATYSLEKGVDPYMATAIILEETGCLWQCSYLVYACNNVGGQKGYGCNGYSAFNSLDEGIIAFIDNLYNNYIAYGLTTPESINPKYAESTTWAFKVNNYIEKIKVQ